MVGLGARRRGAAVSAGGVAAGTRQAAVGGAVVDDDVVPGELVRLDIDDGRLAAGEGARRSCERRDEEREKYGFPHLDPPSVDPSKLVRRHPRPRLRFSELGVNDSVRNGIGTLRG